ncbi:AAA domain-containing protein [Halanaerobacter jeridensis]|uniref:Superfamily I DNA and/or RNA helicase/uncharacterized protein YlzI (FlbEa/FlbD family) n=1 Tax=Halanaerobacter jeridensis TaxID=706427 RepID=A0A938XPD4_9FIRM|nr:AAA domain-containing protein [Halanaerobacter jeridensis]MBM7556768.1 superfamily I DNA and/or RNA helicase/uncharacterized protein YlzI (FlbEa/FlbD family) [Halanaerobacter jeridensis]
MDNNLFAIIRKEVPDPPAIPNLLSKWINVSDDPEDMISIELWENHLKSGIRENFYEIPERELALRTYIKQWEEWAKEAKKIKESKELFNELFNIRKELQYEENLELVLGYGLVVWKENDKLINHPLLTQNMTINHQPKQNKIEVKVPDDAQWNLELEPLIDAGITETEEIRSQFRNLSYESKEENPYVDLFYEASGLSAEGAVAKIEDVKLNPSSQLKVVDGWALFVRNRNQNELLKDIREFNRQLEEENVELPGGLERIITDPEDSPSSWDKDNFHDEWTGLLDKDILFPKEANKEQIQILDSLEHSDGVLVQGPPGTGKSHTIANLISHFMAHGKRTLVTSQKDQALKVLRKMIPESLRSLCLSVLQNDADRKKKLEEAVTYISDIVSNEKDYKLQEEAEDLREKIDIYRRKLQKSKHKLQDLARAELYINMKNFDQPLSPAQAAKKVKDKNKEYSWFNDQPSYQTEKQTIDREQVLQLIPEFSITEREFKQMYDLRKKIYSHLDELHNYQYPNSDDLLNPSDFKDLAQSLAKIDQLQEEADSYYSDLIFKKETALEAIVELAENAVEKYQKITDTWVEELINNQQYPREQLEEAVNKLEELFSELISLQQQLDLTTNINLASEVSLPDYQEFVAEALTKINNDKEPVTWLNFITQFFDGGKTEALKQSQINNSQPETKEEWQQVKNKIDFKIKFREFITAWSGLRNNLGDYLPELETTDNYKAVKEVYEKLKAGIEYTYQLKPQLKEELKETISNHDQLLTNNLDQEIEEIYQVLKIKQEQSEFKSAKQIHQNLRQKLSAVNTESAHQLVERLLSCVPEELARVQEKVDMWEDNYRQLQELEVLEPDYQQFKDLVGKLAEQAPNWAQDWLNADYQTENLYWDNWKEAWQYAALEAYLDDIADSEGKIQKIEAQQKDLEDKLRRSKEQLILVATKLKLKENISQQDVSSLTAWKNAVDKLGKGTGKYAPKWRRKAQEHMQEAKDAVPAWIMPIYRVSETIPKEFGAFDVVIIDEASQSDIRSLLALCRAEKVIVVGDDQQISPSAVGIPHDQVNAFIDQHLDGIPFNEMMDLQTSLYNIADMLFDHQAKLMLKEHFRCVPEIINFSNQEFYNDNILPIRNVPEAEKLQPTLENNFVDEGYIDDRGKVNKPEAEAICQKIKELAENPQYEDKTFGVISLKGKKQAKYIFNEIDNYLTPAQQEKHDFLAGDAYAFQGDERDVMILSLVVGDNKRFRALTSRSAKQRFNVAVSRAKDQLMLFHSVKLSDLNNREDMRYRLLNYIQNGVTTSKELDNPKEIMDSPFEEDVYDWLTERGYQVTPQVEVGSYRIDLVVEGAENRLAVECDGDRWHPPEKWWDDRMRQRQLERVGWKFWRVSGTEFYRNREQAMESIIPRLEELGIKPQDFSD